MIFHCKDKKKLTDIRSGHIPSLVSVLEENIEFYTERCVKAKEDHELYQGMTQALLKIKEAISPKS